MADDELPSQPAPIGDVVFAGGEPTLADDLLDRIRDAVDRGSQSVLVQTNGRRLAYSSYVEELASAGVTHLDVSLHGPTPAIHDYHTGVEGSFLQTAKGIQGAVTSSVEVGVTTVVTRSNFRHLPGVADLLRRLRVRTWHISAARPLGAAGTEGAAVVPRLGMLAPGLQEALRRAEANGITVVTSGIPACIATGATRTRIDTAPPAGARPEPCTSCVAASNCAGPVTGYSAEFAAIDLQPLSDVRTVLQQDVSAAAARFGGIGAIPG